MTSSSPPVTSRTAPAAPRAAVERSGSPDPILLLLWLEDLALNTRT